MAHHKRHDAPLFVWRLMGHPYPVRYITGQTVHVNGGAFLG